LIFKEKDDEYRLLFSYSFIGAIPFFLNGKMEMESSGLHDYGLEIKINSCYFKKYRAGLLLTGNRPGRKFLRRGKRCSRSL
jgi:hypothetical protein